MCRALLISEDGTLVEGVPLENHLCFQNADSINVIGKWVYTGALANHVMQQSVLKNVPSNESNSKGGSTHINVIPVSTKKLHSAFNLNKPGNYSRNLVVSKDILNNNDVGSLSIKVPRFQHTLTNAQHLLPPNVLLKNQVNKISDNQRIAMCQSTYQGSPTQPDVNQAHQVIVNDTENVLPLDIANAANAVTSGSGVTASSVLPLDMIPDDGHQNTMYYQDASLLEDEVGHKNIKEQTNKGLQWSHAMIKFLLQSHNKHKKYKDEGRYMTEKMPHEKISADLQAQGYKDITVTQIENKMKRLETFYKKKMDNMGSSQSGAARFDVPYEDELFDAFRKKHAISPDHLIGVDFEYSKKDDSVSDENADDENAELTEEGPEKSNSQAKKERPSEIDNPQCKKRGKFVMNLTPSQDSIQEKRHQENLERKDIFIKLKSKELALKEGKQKKELAIKEETKKEFLRIQKLKLALETQKLQAQYPDFKFELPQE
ncbi:hypothetical protein QAD02_019635 [Eretmocerus hayati]|uniref:Uncharacterized protein n=1 Tax=Eretmocerus hayati TaxID=131215 RepID=A0ACC2PK53_9HYME|nr:hypothetical protein QAD02_019635 [Eretmocerus hayati]